MRIVDLSLQETFEVTGAEQECSCICYISVENGDTVHFEAKRFVDDGALSYHDFNSDCKKWLKILGEKCNDGAFVAVCKQPERVSLFKRLFSFF